MSTATNVSVTQTPDERLPYEIALLKDALERVYELRVLLDGYSKQLSYEFDAPRGSVERALAYCLLRREQRDDLEARS